MKKLPYILLLSVLMGLMTGCAQQHLTKGDRAYERMAYAAAACHYEKALRSTDDRSVALRAADAYSKQNNMAKAADWYAYADRMAPLTNTDAMNHGRAL